MFWAIVATLFKALEWTGASLIEKLQKANMSKIELYSQDGKTRLGYVSHSKQRRGIFNTLLRSRFTAKARPYYDLLSEDDEILYTIAVPVYEHNFLGCIPAYYDRDFFSIVEGKLSEERNGGLLDPGHGWFVELRPKYEAVIDNCMKKSKSCIKKLSCMTCGLFGLLMEIFKIVEAFIALLRTCPIDHLSQVTAANQAPLIAA